MILHALRSTIRIVGRTYITIALFSLLFLYPILDGIVTKGEVFQSTHLLNVTLLATSFICVVLLEICTSENSRPVIPVLACYLTLYLTHIGNFAFIQHNLFGHTAAEMVFGCIFSLAVVFVIELMIEDVEKSKYPEPEKYIMPKIK